MAKITQKQLIEKLQDIEISDAELAKYFIVDEHAELAFNPRVIPNPDLVEEDEYESAILLNTFNSLSRWRRNCKYRQRIKRWTGVKIVAEGDSWFQYPFLLKDIIDQLTDLEHFNYAIYGLSEAGDLLSNIIREDEMTRAIKTENPDVFLISGGGNDLLGNGRLSTMVHSYNSQRKVKNYPNKQFDLFLKHIEKLYRQLFDRLLILKPHLKIICHGYDEAIPNNGIWLGQPLLKKKIKKISLQKKIIIEIMARLNSRLANIAADYPNSVYYIDCRGTVDSNEWYDELHPKDHGFYKVAQLFDEAIKKALKNKKIASIKSPENNHSSVSFIKTQKLNNHDFLDLIVHRAKKILKKTIKTPKTKYERKLLEKVIEKQYEKIYKNSNFLKSSFLEMGVKSAQAVCRIVTDTSYGSGSLVASRQFILTNNHVISDKQTARQTTAEFDYDEDNMTYQVSLRPDLFFITDETLDFTVVACDPSPLPSSIQAIPILADPKTVTRNERVSIIQHPRGRTKEIAIHDNKVTFIYDTVIRYTTDTEAGSSGSPVFNNSWDLVALHHAGMVSGETVSNEGIRISSIVEFIQQQNNQESINNADMFLEHVIFDGDTDFNMNKNNTKSTVLPKERPNTSDNHTKRSFVLNLEGDIDELTIRLK